MINLRHEGRVYVNVNDDSYASMGIPENVYRSAVADENWKEIRTRRDAALHNSDYAVMPDYPLTEAQLADVKQYRQALRDIPETATDPDAIEWPEKPEVLA